MKVTVSSENENRYIRLRLTRAVGSFLAMHALDIRAEDFFCRKGVRDTKVQELIKKQLQQSRDLLLPLKSEIVARLNEYLSEEDRVDLKGFLRFRLKNLDSFITLIIWRLADQAQLEQEWTRLIAFLRRFRQNYGQGIKQVHCMRGDGGNFIICDKRGVQIGDGLTPSLPADELGNEDLLIGTLITMGARKVTFHGYTPSSQALKLLQSIFYFKKCTGCSLCRKREMPRPG